MVDEHGGSSAVPGPRVGASAVPAWFDRFLASDPGLNRLRLALQAVATIGLAMAVEWIFVRATGAMELDAPAGLPAAQAAAIEAQHHAVTVIGVMLGAVVGMISSFTGGMFPDVKAQLGGFVLMPVLMVAGLAMGLSLAPYRTLSLAMLVVILAVGAYCRRFGPLGFVGGQMVFMGHFFGFFLNGAIGIRDIGWLAAEICLAVAVAVIAQFTVFYPGRRRALARMQRSYDARRRDVVDYSVRLLDEAARPETAQPERVAAGLQRRLVRLNEAALMIDGQLSNPGAIPRGWSAATLHQILFDAELAVSNMARFVAAVAMAEAAGEHPPAEVHGAVRETLVAVSLGDYARADRLAHDLLDDLRARSCGDAPALGDDLHVVVHRFALSVIGYADAQRRWREAGEMAEARADGEAATDVLESPVVLMAGFLPGSTMVSATASEERDPAYDDRSGWHAWHFWHHVPLTPNVRVAIQMAVAVGAAIILGDVLSGRRFYWAVIAAFVTFMGANNASEQVRKGINRVIGTVVGALVGATLAHLVGNHTYVAIAVILGAIFFGLYLMRVSYAFMVIGITVMVSQLYVQLDEFSDSLLLLRLEETALGAAVAAVTVVCVLPLRTGRVARVAAREFLTALDEVVAKAVAVLSAAGDAARDAETAGSRVAVEELRAATRRLDDSYQSLVAISRFLRMPVFDRAGSQRDQFQTAATAARNYARNLLVDAPLTVTSGQVVPDTLVAAHEQFTASLRVLLGWLEAGTATTPYVRSASLFDRIDADGPVGTPLQLALADLERLDGALAMMAGSLGVEVVALDTAEV